MSAKFAMTGFIYLKQHANNYAQLNLLLKMRRIEFVYLNATNCSKYLKKNFAQSFATEKINIMTIIIVKRNVQRVHFRMKAIIVLLALLNVQVASGDRLINAILVPQDIFSRILIANRFAKKENLKIIGHRIVQNNAQMICMWINYNKNAVFIAQKTNFMIHLKWNV